jgi:hypothetical protein
MLRDWSDELILEFVRRYAEAHEEEEPPGFRAFRELIEAGRYEQLYGDIPKRPLFLGMLLEDAWSGEDPARQLHRLYGKYFRHKFSLDRQGIAALGTARRPSALIDALGLEEAAERLIAVMQDAAEKMYQVTAAADQPFGVQHDTIGEADLRAMASRHSIPFVQIEELAMHSLLQPAGRHVVSRERLARFAHRSFQDWFLARHYAAHKLDDAGLPDAAARFLAAVRADLAAGQSLP